LVESQGEPCCFSLTWRPQEDAMLIQKTMNRTIGTQLMMVADERLDQRIKGAAAATIVRG
jgi:hypothetical protein